jgi:RHS repeat-associated protein
MNPGLAAGIAAKSPKCAGGSPFGGKGARAAGLVADSLACMRWVCAREAGPPNNFKSSILNLTTDGSLTADNNKGISSITYNMLGKPMVVNFTTGKKIEYIYDAAGVKLTMRTYQGATLLTTTNYSGSFVYEGAAPVLSFFGSPEGRIVKNGTNYEYQYAIADHQGNTRVVFTSATPITQTVTATFESSAQASEATQFSNYPSASGINTVSTNNVTPGGTRSQYLNAGYIGRVGVAKSYKVYAGDKVKIEANARYNAPSSTNSSLTDFANILLAAFGLPNPPVGETGTAAAAVKNWGTIAAGGYGNGTPANGFPKAFVNIILFDANYKFLDFAFAQVTSSGAPALIQREYEVKEAGYAYVFISNEHPTQADVYFDDVKMSYTPSRVIQQSEYYPFGMQTANSWTRENTTGNNFLGNGGTELNTTSQLYDLDYRNYDPVLGRMNGVDPMATKYASLSPYNFSFNDPVTFSDPSGADPNDHYFYGTYYTNDDWKPERYLGLYNCGQCWRSGQSLAFLGAATGYGNSVAIGDDGSWGSSASQFLSSALNSQYGGSWSTGQSNFFESYEEALFAGMIYVERTNSWSYTQWGSASATWAYFETTQSLMNPDYGSMCACLEGNSSVEPWPQRVPEYGMNVYADKPLARFYQLRFYDYWNVSKHIFTYVELILKSDMRTIKKVSGVTLMKTFEAGEDPKLRVVKFSIDKEFDNFIRWGLGWHNPKAVWDKYFEFILSSEESDGNSFSFPKYKFRRKGNFK